MPDRPDITPELKVGALLDAYPELEETLAALAPAFAKLRNPMLRKTVARVTSLRQAAAVGGVSVGELIGSLRSAAGLETAWTGDDPGPVESADAMPRPDWITGADRLATFDARPMIEAGEMSLPTVMAALQELVAGQIYTFVTPFAPAPLIDRITAAGLETWTERVGPEEFRTHCRRVKP